MDVHVLTYDLSRGLARQMSASLLGFHLDAVYHTSIEFAGREWVYDGGIVTIVPGTSHLGAPMERIFLGQTELPVNVVEEYVDSLREIFTLEAYDLFRHNCNNFSDSFAKFLLGGDKGIPERIISMPQRVLASPMGAMLYRQLSQSVNSSRQGGSILGIQQPQQKTAGNGTTPPGQSHFHDALDVPSFKSLDAKYVVFAKVPPMDKLLAKLDDAVASSEPVVALKTFIETRAKEGAVDATLPNLHQVETLFKESPLFPLVDLLRCALVDPRVSAHFAQHEEGTLTSLLSTLGNDTPYALRLVTLQTACNMFGSPIFADKTLHSQTLRSLLLRQIAANLFDAEHAPTRVAAASLAFNLAIADRRCGRQSRDLLLADDQAELAASLAEGLLRESTPDAVDAMLAALGHLVYGRAKDSDLVELLRAVEVVDAVKKASGSDKTKRLVGEVVRLLEALDS